MTSFPVVLGVVVGGVVDVVVVRLGRSLNGSTLSSTAIKDVFFKRKGHSEKKHKVHVAHPKKPQNIVISPKLFLHR